MFLTAAIVIFPILALVAALVIYICLPPVFGMVTNPNLVTGGVIGHSVWSNIPSLSSSISFTFGTLSPSVSKHPLIDLFK